MGLFELFTIFDWITPMIGTIRDIKETAETFSETGFEGLIKLKGFIHVPDDIDYARDVLEQRGFLVRRVEYEFKRVVLEHPNDFDAALQLLREHLIEAY